MSTVIQISNLSKLYRLGEIGTGTISHDLERWFKMKVRGQEDPFLKIGASNDRSKKGGTDVVFSLRDINFEVKQGDALGIIGKNGAGKSTLLKILSRVTSPTTGSVNIKGRIASLLEVGTGFHPELTGRENIYLNGAILGMRKREISRKLDEIIDFSGVDRYIDTPVKRYSSGMYVRLAFAVAAHLESEILIVDEVLAVGDAEFQKKCLGKMGDVSKDEGRTVLFVSHNISSVNALCNKSIVLENGENQFFGSTQDAIKVYESTGISEASNIKFIEPFGDNHVNLKGIHIFNPAVDQANVFYREDPINIQFLYEVFEKDNIYVSIHINQGSQCIFVGGSESEIHQKGIYQIDCIIPPNLLSNLTYSISFFIVRNMRIMSARAENKFYFNVNEKNEFATSVMGLIRPNLHWSEPKLISK
jgi:lipopolysaccharide transport system ATP-binding protein